LALGLIALLILVAQSLTSGSFQNLETDSRTINLAGRQRMLFLIISRASLVLAHESDGQGRARAGQRLAEALEPWRQVHEGLINGDRGLGLTGRNCPRAARLLAEMEPARSQVLEAARQMLTRWEADQADGGLVELAAAIARWGEVYLGHMDKLVLVYEQEAKQRVIDLLRLEWILTFLTLLALVLVGLFIFRPMAKRIRRDMAQLEGVAQAFEQLSLTDGLTGLANRRALDRALDEEWRRAWRHGESLALLMLDIDHFKNYNDLHGHQEGDRVLKAVAQVLREAVKRPGDLAARYGGEELAVLLVGADLAGAQELARELCQRVEGLSLAHGASPVSPVLTVSLGVSAARPRPGSRPRELLGAADQALYRAKAEGRNRVEIQALDLAAAPGNTGRGSNW
jgi:diguanylate cyclase (GGDEF)-like protein